MPALMTELGVVLRLLDRLASRPLALPLFATGGMASGGVVSYSVNARASAVVRLDSRIDDASDESTLFAAQASCFEMGLQRARSFDTVVTRLSLEV